MSFKGAQLGTMDYFFPSFGFPVQLTKHYVDLVQLTEQHVGLVQLTERHVGLVQLTEHHVGLIQLTEYYVGLVQWTERTGALRLKGPGHDVGEINDSRSVPLTAWVASSLTP